VTEKELIELVARAIYEAFEEEGSYVGAYRFHDGDTTLDGQWDLDNIARVAIKVIAENDPTL
jgi:hypothetical protein